MGQHVYVLGGDVYDAWSERPLPAWEFGDVPMLHDAFYLTMPKAVVFQTREDPVLQSLEGFRVAADIDDPWRAREITLLYCGRDRTGLEGNDNVAYSGALIGQHVLLERTDADGSGSV